MGLDDDEAARQAEKPLRSEGTIKVDDAKREARHDANLKLALTGRSVAIIILGGSHDLSASVRRFGQDVEYIRVTTAAFRDVAQEASNP